MPFPILALLAAAASDAQSHADERDALAANGRNTVSGIMRARARELGGSPYGLMAADGAAANGDISRHAAASRNNNIGSMLQAYLKTSGGDNPEKFGDAYESSFTHQPNLQYGTDAGIGMGDAMGKAQVDSWDKDPWGDAGF